MDNFADIYTDYLICSTSLTTATGMASLLDIKHDKITRSLRKGVYDSKYLWLQVKPMVQELTTSKAEIVLCFDDSIEEKMYTDESPLICWHYDHVFNRNVKGVNFLSALVDVGGSKLPVEVEFVKKDNWELNPKNGKQRRVSSQTKNEQFREMIARCAYNFRFDYVVADSWYSSAENMQMIKQAVKSNFVIALKSNRLVALSPADKKSDKYVNIDSLQPEQQTVEVWFKELDFPLLLVKQVFKNEDGTVGELYLACSDLNLSYERITTIYKKRWGVEVYHKSVKSNVSFAKSPTKTQRTQTNHFILSILGYVKLELLYLRKNKNHFTMKQIIYQAATKAAHLKLKELFTSKAA